MVRRCNIQILRVKYSDKQKGIVDVFFCSENIVLWCLQELSSRDVYNGTLEHVCLKTNSKGKRMFFSQTSLKFVSTSLSLWFYCESSVLLFMMIDCEKKKIEIENKKCI